MIQTRGNVLLRSLLCGSIAAISLISLFAISANAQAPRTWVSGVGDDANPCSRTAPCKTFAGAISKTAANGAINCLDPGGYGAVTITKSITIDCKQTVGGILAAGTSGIIINAANIVVRIRGVNIDGAGTGIIGIRVVAAGKVNVEESEIDGFTQHGISIENQGSAQVVVDRMTIRNCAGNGVNVATVGVADVTVNNSVITQNGIGVSVGGPNATTRLTSNVIAYNTTGLSGGKIVSYKDNLIDGNVNNGSVSSSVSRQ